MKPPVLLIAVAVGLLSAVPVSAQSPAGPGRPNRSLFGPTHARGSLDQSLSANASLGGGLDDNIDDRSGIGPTQSAPSSTFASGSGSLSYQLNRTRAQFFASAATSVRFYTELDDHPFVLGHSVSAGGSFGLTSRTQLSTSVGLYYMPRYFLAVVPTSTNSLPGKLLGAKLRQSIAQQLGPDTLVDFSPQPGVAPTPGSPERIDMQTGTSANLSLSQRITKRVGLYVGYGYSRSDDVAAGQGRLENASVGGGVTVQVGRGVGFNVGYGFSDATYGPSDARTHFRRGSGSAGLDFNRALSLSRRATVGFGTGWSAVGEPGGPVFYRLTGSADFNYELGRSWTASAGYSRDAGFVQTFRAPVMSDSLSAGLGGQLSRRIGLNTGVGLMRGQVGLQQTDNGFDSAVARAGIQIALSRHLAIDGNYSYYRYTFGSAVALPIDAPRRLNRQAFSISLAVWAPIIERARRP